WIDHFNGRETTAVATLRQTPLSQVLIGDLIMVEVLQGFRREEEFRAAAAFFSTLEFSSMAGREIALTAARNHRFLRQRGVSVRKTVDTLIATFCLVWGHQLLHNDRDFDSFEKHLGLRVVGTRIH